MTTSRTGQDRVSVNSQKLVSWKSIAAYFDCDERTAKRWELERELPVHRAPGKKRSGVFAYPSEIDAWLQTETRERNPHIEASAKRRQTGDGDTESFPVESPETMRRALAPPSATALRDKLSVFRRWPIWVTISAFTLLAIAAAQVIRSGRYTIQAGSRSVSTSAGALRHAPATDAEYLYLRGRYFWNLRSSDGLARALDAYTQAIVKDPSYAEAYAGLAETYDLLPQFGQADLGDSFTKAKMAADHALAINPNLASAHTAKAFAIFFWDWDIAGSDAEFKRALVLDPNSAQTHQWFASTLHARLEGPECLKEIDEALRLSPTSAAIATDAALFHASFSDFDAGVRSLKEMEQTQPTLALPAQLLEDLDFRVGNNSAYVADARRYASITRRGDDLALADAIERGWTRARTTGLLEARARVLKAAFDHGTESGFLLGETLIVLGRQKEALPYFRASLNKHYIRLITMEQCPWAKELSRDPGYAALFKQVRERLHGNYPAHPPVAPVFLRLPM
jgi:tetratricopeptide (TPR) repeat protein